MADGTRARGRNDTRGDRAPTRRRSLPRRAFAITLTIAFFLHAAFMPSSLTAWIARFFSGSLHDYDDPDAQAIIPIDFDLLANDPSQALAATPPEPPAPTPEPATAPPSGEGPALVDAGLPDAATVRDASTDAAEIPLSDAGRPPRPRPDGGVGDAGPDTPAPLRDPIAAAGGAGKISSNDANVQVLVSGRVLRKHEVGATLGRLLVIIPEWKQFFEGTGIDPIRDVNNILLTAPRLRGNASKMVVVMDYNVAETKMRAALDLLVQRVGGSWIDDAPIPAARAKVLSGERIFALVPNKKLLVVGPVETVDQLGALKTAKGFSTSAVGAVISMVKPAPAFKGIFALPSTIKWMRVAITPTEGGGADVVVEGGDASAEDAKEHAPEITKEFDGVRMIGAWPLTFEVVDHAEFKAEGDVIRARVRVSAAQLKRILGFAEAQLIELGQQGSAKPKKGAKAGASAAPEASAAPKSTVAPRGSVAPVVDPYP